MAKPSVRKESKYVPLTKDQFRDRFFAKFQDPAFNGVEPELEKVFEVAWDGYINYRKSPRTRPAGKGYSDPQYELSVGSSETRARLQAAGEHPKKPRSRSRI